jgi:hypothetical protein
MHRREAAHSGATDEPQQERLGLIVTRVPQGDPIRAKFNARAFQEGEPRAACGRLN